MTIIDKLKLFFIKAWHIFSAPVSSFGPDQPGSWFTITQTVLTRSCRVWGFYEKSKVVL